MANIRIDLGYSIINGSEAVFVAPCDCSDIGGLVVYYPKSNKLNSPIVSTEFVFKDAHGSDLSDMDHLFKAGAYVKVILNVTEGIAYIQNADTNSYIENKFKDIEYLEYAEATALTKLSSKEKLSIAFGKIAKAITDLISHIANKNNPHGVTATQVGALTSSNIVDNLLSTDATLPLSAKQGKALNDSKAPNNHASTGTTYGMATSENYGHVKLSGSVSNTSGKDSGVAATPSAVKNAYDRGTTAINDAKAISDRLINIANVITNEQLTFSLASNTGTVTTKNIFVAPASGIYFIDAYAIFTANTNGNRFFSLGGVDLDGMTVAPANGNSTAIKLNTVVYMAQGQQFFVNLRQTSGSALNVTVKSRYSYLPL